MLFSPLRTWACLENREPKCSPQKQPTTEAPLLKKNNAHIWGINPCTCRDECQCQAPTKTSGVPSENPKTCPKACLALSALSGSKVGPTPCEANQFVTSFGSFRTWRPQVLQTLAAPGAFLGFHPAPVSHLRSLGSLKSPSRPLHAARQHLRAASRPARPRRPAPRPGSRETPGRETDVGQKRQTLTITTSRRRNVVLLHSHASYLGPA